ncbi:MAG: DUF4143 domain-containing protein [Opitutales bacterium]|nr:DUF4143 domain-containing protein [Opitutales bacterium]
MVRQLQPWFENLAKRQVKSPKIYLRDPGLLHLLLGLPTWRALEGHPKVGASWEGFALEEVCRLTRASDAYFWATQSGAELDLLLFLNGKRIGFEFKFTGNPRVTRSMRVATEDLRLDHLFVIVPGDITSRVAESIDVVGLETFVKRPPPEVRNP